MCSKIKKLMDTCYMPVMVNTDIHRYRLKSIHSVHMNIKAIVLIKIYFTHDFIWSYGKQPARCPPVIPLPGTHALV